MSPEMWRSLRWPIVLGVCVLLVAVVVPLTIDSLRRSVVFDGEQEDGDFADVEAEEPVDEPLGPVADGQAPPQDDFVVSGGAVTQAAARALSIAEQNEAAVFIFPVIDGDAACVAAVALEIQLLQADPTEVAVYAARPLEANGEVGSARADDTVHALALTDGSPGRLRWDVTALYRAWAEGEIAPAGSPFAIAVAPPGPPAELSFASSEALERNRPALVWEGEPGCGVEAA